MAKEYLVLKQFQDMISPSDPVWAKRDIWVEKLNPGDKVDKYKTKKGAEDKEKKLKKDYPDKKFKIINIYK